MNRYQWKYKVTGPKLVLATLTVVVTMAFAGGIAFAGVGTEVNETASLRLTSTGFNRSSLKGFARLQLHVSEQNGSSFRASAQVEGDGLVENQLYAMWLAGPEGNTLLIDTARADEECEVDPDTGKEDCEKVVDLRGFLAQAPLNITTLEGLTINIREHAIAPQGNAPVLMTGTVTRSDLARFIGQPSPLVGTNIANSFGEANEALREREQRIRFLVRESIHAYEEQRRGTALHSHC